MLHTVHNLHRVFTSDLLSSLLMDAGGIMQRVSLQKRLMCLSAMTHGKDVLASHLTQVSQTQALPQTLYHGTV